MRRRQTGQLVAAALILIAVIGAMIVSLGFLGGDDTRSATVNAQSAQALDAATSGLEYAAYRMRSDTTAFAVTCANLNNVSQTVASGVSTFKLTTTSVAAASTTLSGALNATATTAITVASAASFPSHGRMRIDSEEIAYTGKTATTFTGIRRGAAGTAANVHAASAPVNGEAQCIVRATGNADAASRMLESSFIGGPRTAFLDGTSTSIAANATTVLGTLATTLPTGTNIIIATVTLQNTTATATTIAATNVQLRNSTTATTLASNAFQFQVGGTATATNNNRSTKTHFFVWQETNAAANQSYQVRITAPAGIGTTVGETKILVINSPRSTVANALTGTVNPVSNGGSTIVSLATTLPGTPAVQNAVNVIVASVQMDATSGNSGRTIAAGNLRLNRNGAQIDSNQFTITFRSNGNVNQEFSHLLIAADNGAPANPTYSVTAIASNNNSIEVEAKIVAFQGPAALFVDGGSTPLAATATQLAALTANAFPALAAGANVAIIGSTQYIASTNSGGPYWIAAGAENLVYSGASQATNAFQHFLCNTNTSNGECDHIGGALLWQQTFAAGNPRSAPSYTMQSAGSTANRINGETKLLVMQLEPVADRIEIF